MESALEEIRGEKVVLRDLRREDADAMAAWPKFAEPELDWANFSLATGRERDVWFYEERSRPSYQRWAVTTQDGQLIGLVSLRSIDRLSGSAILGIRFSPTNVDQGFGTDCIKSLLNYAFTHMGLRRIDLDVLTTNYRARRCYAKCGFEEMERYRSFDGHEYIVMRAVSQNAGVQFLR
ncbi:MAG: GNAT family N-acetyltransferase [Chloroflexi bacterium]|nr:GNAT family N-acetyltransferase [Chloroflexota bacterium]